MVALRRDELVLPIFMGRSEPRITGLGAGAEEIAAMDFVPDLVPVSGDLRHSSVT
jgi:hypothetical protein